MFAPDVTFKTEFPRGVFGLGVQHAAGIAATGKVPVLRLTLSGFDTHQNQLGIHANLLKVVAESVVALRAALSEHGVWDRTLILTYSEFGRRPRENQSGGTDHGTAGALFAFGPHVRGGVHGDAPSLRALDEAATCGTRPTFAASMPRCSNTGGNCRPSACCSGASSR